MRRTRISSNYPWLLGAPLGALIVGTAGEAAAATPTYYDNLPALQAVMTASVTDDYSNPGYGFIQNDATMSAVLGETDYESTGFLNLNIVSGGVYCAGCNGSFELSFQTTSVGNADGVSAVGANIQFNDPGTPYFAFITFADGTTDNIQLPPAGSFWAVSAPERIERIHFGLSNGATTTAGSFGIDNLVIGDVPPAFEACDGQVLDVSSLTPGSGAAVTQPGSTAGATDDIFESIEVACWSGSEAVEHVYQFSLAVPTSLQIDLDGSAYDTKLAVVAGCPDGAEFCLYNDDYGGVLASGFDCTPFPAGSYSAIVSGFSGSSGDYVLDLTECGGACGDGNVDPGEACDDAGESADCDADCTLVTCGDGLANASAGEACDDAGESADCDADCTPVSCGDAVANVAAGEACDDGGESATCDDDCTAAACGDSVVNNTAGETCDDGGRSAQCNGDCTAASCGDGIVNATAGEECDGDGAGNPGETASCDDDCTSAMCGDTVVNASADEECDDGNTDDGDGCSASCVVEEAGTSSGSDGGSSDGGSSDGGSSDGGSSDGGSSDGGADSSGGVDTSDGGSASASDTDTDGGGDSSGAADSSGGAGDTGRGTDDSGCGCSTDPTENRRGTALSAITVLLLGALRRRRRT
jgi:MYXO-CTERM domain-containing protein